MVLENLLCLLYCVKSVCVVVGVMLVVVLMM